MPSRAVDEAWHEYILYTSSYHALCQQVLGRYLHHVPAEAMQSATRAQEGLRRAWQLSCQHERVNPRQPNHLPRLFALDTELNFPGGLNYYVDRDWQSKRTDDAYSADQIGCSGATSCVSVNIGDGDEGGASDGGGCGGGCGGD